ncbi:MAG: response regulator [Theionarchaea archaeon]|nr:response regulator [Theionarchaea archaeon]
MVRILWIEDEGNTDLIQYKQPMVEAGYAVDVAETAAEALDFLDSMDYDVYIVDLLLPQEGAFRGYIELPGVEVLKEMVREYGINPEKVMIFTVVNDEEVHEDIRNLGLEKIVVKGLQPIDFLKEEIDKILEKGRR